MGHIGLAEQQPGNGATDHGELALVTESEDTAPISNRVLAVAESLDLPPGATYDDVKDQYLRGKLLDADGADGAGGAQDPD